MKNIHILPTSQPSKLWFYKEFENLLTGLTVEKSRDIHPQNIYITNSEEIKEGDWFIDVIGNTTIHKSDFKKNKISSRRNVVLTTDQELQKDGVQAIDDEFLEWFVKNPSCEELKIGIEIWNDGTFSYRIIIPKEEQCSCKVGEPYNNACCKIHGSIPKEELKKEFVNNTSKWNIEDFEEPTQETLEEAINREFPLDNSYKEREAMFIGAKWQQERSYSEVFDWLSKKDYLSDKREVIEKEFKEYLNK